MNPKKGALVGLGAMLASFVAAAPLAGQSGAGTVRVSDPAELAAMGFGPGAVVFRASGGGGSEPDAPDEFGTVVSGYAVYNGNQFHGTSTNYTYNCALCSGDVFYAGGGTPFADVQLEMPSGSSLRGVRWWGFDDNAEDLSVFLFRTCLPAFAPGNPASALLGSDASSGTPGATGGFINPPPETVDNQACTYWVRVHFEAAADDLRLYKVRVQWERQVSPAPAVATFNDVPTDHPFFQFIEALSESAITAGCSEAPPMYCPDAPLTRGQMAVFLSKALGLQWP